TALVDVASAELLREALLRLRRRHVTLLINLEDPELARLAMGAPRTEAEAFAKVSALEIALANRRLGRRLRGAGIRVVTSSAERITLDALETYLAVAAAAGSPAAGAAAAARRVTLR